MMRSFFHSGAILSLLACVALAADDLPTMDQLKQLQDDKNWPELLKATTRVLTLKGPLAEGYKRPDVWLFKAEAQLQSKQFIPAAQSFESAAKEKSVTPEVTDQCAALAAIMKKSDARGFHLAASKENAQSQVYDIFDPSKRPDAIKAMFDAEYDDLSRDFTKAKTKAAVPELSRIARRVVDLPPYERAANGSDEKSKQMLNDVAALAAESMVSWVNKQNSVVQKIRESANEMIPVPDREFGAITRKRGLLGKDRQDLQEVMKGCERLVGTYKQFLDAAGGERTELAEVPKQVENLYEDAKRVLHDDYSGRYRSQ